MAVPSCTAVSVEEGQGPTLLLPRSRTSFLCAGNPHTVVTSVIQARASAPVTTPLPTWPFPESQLWHRCPPGAPRSHVHGGRVPGLCSSPGSPAPQAHRVAHLPPRSGAKSQEAPATLCPTLLPGFAPLPIARMYEATHFSFQGSHHHLSLSWTPISFHIPPSPSNPFSTRSQVTLFFFILVHS